MYSTGILACCVMTGPLILSIVYSTMMISKGHKRLNFTCDTATASCACCENVSYISLDDFGQETLVSTPKPVVVPHIPVISLAP